MRKFWLIGALPLLLILGALGCSKDDSPPDRTFADVEKDFQAIEIKPGTQDLELKITEDVTYSFRVIFPDVDLSQDWPLILTLHGYSAGHPDAHKQTACYVEPGLEDMDVIILSPNGGAEDWETLQNDDQLRILIQLSTQYWPVDISKIVVSGYSNGGNGSWYYAETQPGIFSAAIPLAAGYSIVKPDGTGRKINIPMYVIHGSEDDLFPLDTVQRWANLSIQAGSDITFVVAEGLGHYTPCEYVDYFKDAAAWLENEVW